MSNSILEHPILVPDTSVIIKWFRQQEVLAPSALAVREAYLAGQTMLSIPSLMAYEVANVLRYKGELTTEQVQKAMQSLFEMDLEWIAPTVGLMNRAIEIARSYETTVYDATFVAVAAGMNAVFITADERLVRRMAEFPFVCYLGELETL